MSGLNGLGQVEAIRFNSDSPAGHEFFKLEYTTNPAAPLLQQDFDLDKVLNFNELDLGLNPFSNADLDLDGIPDDWERYYLQTVLFTEAADEDDDGYNLVDEYQLSFNPTERQADVAPVISVISGLYENERYVDFVNPYSEGLIYFTTDGSDPTIASASFETIQPDNRTDTQIAFLSPAATAQEIPEGSNALDAGQALGDPVLTTAESSAVFGWETALSSTDFGETTIQSGGQDYAFSYVNIPQNNSWTLKLEPAQYVVELQILNSAGNTFSLEIEGDSFDESNLVASSIADVHTLSTTVSVRDGYLTLRSSQLQTLQLSRVSTQFAGYISFSDGQAPYSSLNLLRVANSPVTIKAAVGFPDGSLSAIASEVIDLSDTLGATSQVYYGAIAETNPSLPGIPVWGYTTSTSSFLIGYPYFSMGQGWISSGAGSFIPDESAAIPSGGAYIVSAEISNHSKVEFFSYDNPSIQNLVTNNDAFLIPVGTRYISGPRTLAPADVNTARETVYYGRRSTIFFSAGTTGVSTSPAVFFAGEYMCNGTGHIRALPELDESEVSIVLNPDFVPDRLSSQEVFVGTSDLLNGSFIHLSTDATLLRSNRYTSLGHGWIVDQFPNTQFIPDTNEPAQSLYLGYLQDGSKQHSILASSQLNLASTLPLGSGWVEEFYGHSFAMQPDQAGSFSQALYLHDFAIQGITTLSTASTGSDASLGHGWILSNDTYMTDPTSTGTATIYYGYVDELARCVYSYDSSSMLEGGARVTDGVILSEDSIETSGLAEDVYYAPVPLFSSGFGAYDFTYSNQSSSDAALMGQGIIHSREDAEIDVSAPVGDIYYGVVASSSGNYRAYSKTTTPFISSRYVKVGSGHIVSQDEDELINVLLDNVSEEDIWHGSLSGTHLDYANRVFRSASSFSGTPPDPQNGGSHYYSEGGVTYFYSGEGSLHDARSYTPDLDASAATVYEGYTQQNHLYPWMALTVSSAQVNFPAPLDSGWTYGEDGSQQILEGSLGGVFAHPSDPQADFDQDGLSTYEEIILHGTDPKTGDTDGDLVPDALEIALGRNPRVYDDPFADDDGVSNYVEYLNGSDPNEKDSDGDGIFDNIEIALGSDPNDPTQTPDNLDLSQQVEMSFSIGDWSGSRSERYRIEVYEVDPDTGEERFVYRLSATTHGEVVEGSSNRFTLGKSYKARIFWEGSKIEDPDYDWIMELSANIPMLKKDPNNAGQWLTIEANELDLEAPSEGIGVITDEYEILGTHSETDLADPTVFEHEGRAVEFELHKMEFVPHWPTTIKNSFDIPDYVVDGQVVAPGTAVPLHEVDDRDNVYLLVNNDNDDYDSVPDDPSSNYPDDRFEASGPSLLKHDKDDDAVMLRVAFPAAENMDSGTLELRTGSGGGIDSRIAIYHAADRDSDGVLLTEGQLSLDLSNPDMSSPLSALTNGEEVKLFIEGTFALQTLESVDVGLYLTIGGNETKLSDFTLKLHKTDVKSMKFVAHSSVGSFANGWTKDRMQDSSNAVRIDNDREANDDRIVPINFRRRDVIPIDDGDGSLDLRQISRFNSQKENLVRGILSDQGAQYYVTDQVTDAGGFSMVNDNGTPSNVSDDFPYKMVVVPYRKGNSSLAGTNTDEYVIAHEWLHAFANLDHESCLDNNLMVNQSEDPCSSNPDSEIGPYVNESQKNGFVDNDS